MKKTVLVLIVLVLCALVWTQAAPPEGSLMGWTSDQLKSEVYRLRREVQDLRTRLGMTDTVEIKSKAAVKVPKGSWRVEDFEKQYSDSGIGGWWADCDH